MHETSGRIIEGKERNIETIGIEVVRAIKSQDSRSGRGKKWSEGRRTWRKGRREKENISNENEESELRNY